MSKREALFDGWHPRTRFGWVAALFALIVVGNFMFRMGESAWATGQPSSPAVMAPCKTPQMAKNGG